MPDWISLAQDLWREAFPRKQLPWHTKGGKRPAPGTARDDSSAKKKDNDNNQPKNAVNMIPTQYLPIAFELVQEKLEK